MLMQRKAWICAWVTALIFFSTVFIIGCEVQDNNPPARPITTPSLRLTPTNLQQPTPTSSNILNLLDPTLVPIQHRLENHLTQFCLQTINNAEQWKYQSLFLVLYDRNHKISFLYDRQANESFFLDNANEMFIDVAPNHKWLAYLQEISNNSQLIVRSFSGAKIYTIKLDVLKESATLAGWVGNEHLLFGFAGHQPQSVRAINPFMNEQKTLIPNFPGIYDNDAWDWDFSGRTIYSPDFRFVVYPSAFNNGDSGIAGDVLWDIQTGKKIANVLVGIGGNLIAIPKWSPDGQAFAVKVMGRNADELYSANVDGTVTVLTNLLRLFPDATTQIRSWSWAPDSQKIAFWLDFYNNEALKDERLMVLDLKSGEVTDYCVFGDSIQIQTELPDFTPAPVWSPDSRFLLVEQRTNLTESALILVSLDTKTAYMIGQDSYPLGWMVNEP